MINKVLQPLHLFSPYGLGCLVAHNVVSVATMLEESKQVCLII